MLMHAALATTFLLAPVEVSLDTTQQLKASDSHTTRVYIVRHGESAFNVPDANGINYTTGKSLTVPLTEKGQKQADLVGTKIANKLSKDSQVVVLSSTALRAQDTADRIFNALKANYKVERGESDENFCELGHGKWEGLPKDEAYKKAFKIWEDLPAKDKYVYPKLSTGETPYEVAERFYVGFEKALRQHPNKTIIITSHYAAMNALALKLSGYIGELSSEPASPLPSIHLENCDILLLEVEEGAPAIQTEVKMHIKAKV